jgi:hypothetical protein
MREAGRVGAHEQLGALGDGARELPERPIDARNLVFGGVRAGVAGAQNARECLLRCVEVAQHGVNSRSRP